MRRRDAAHLMRSARARLIGHRQVLEVLAAQPARKDVVLVGLEAHVCCLQTVCDLAARGYRVHIVADGISSQRALDRSVGIARMQARIPLEWAQHLARGTSLALQSLSLGGALWGDHLWYVSTLWVLSWFAPLLTRWANW